MALEKAPEAQKYILLEGLNRRPFEKSTLMHNALARNHSDQVQRKEPKSELELEGCGLKRFGKPEAEFSHSPKWKGPGER